MLKNRSLESMLERDFEKRCAPVVRDDSRMRDAIKQTQDRITHAFAGAPKIPAKVKGH